MKHGFINVAAVSPKVCIAACDDNISEIIKLTRCAEDAGARIVVFPELCVTGASCGDLFFSDTLLDAAKKAVCRFVESTENSDTIIIIGFPLVVNDNLYNCAAICQDGRILGVVPKSILNINDMRYFSVPSDEVLKVKIGEHETSFGVKQMFACSTLPALKIGIEVGDEAFAPISPATYCALAGATVIVNPFAGFDIVGADERREQLFGAFSAKCICAYIHAATRFGESTTDGVYGGNSLIYENGTLLENSSHSVWDNGICIPTIDLGIISHDRRMATNFASVANNYAVTEFEFEITETKLDRYFSYDPFIFTKNSPHLSSEYEEKILSIQARGLAQRIVKAHAKTCVIGISGGLDSTLAVLVAARACDMLGKPRTDIIGVTMPCFGTTARTKSNAELLCSALGTQLRTVNIGDSVKQHFADIGHDENDHNVVYENAQARERTQVIMDIANMENGLVIGTGDLSELCLGWATYNGDHMSMYSVNAGVPKMLIRAIVKYCADTTGDSELSSVLRDILDTPVSPELLPADENGNIAQKTEDLVGPYEIHDFYIYYTLRYGFSPDKLYRMAKRRLGHKYSDEELKKWLKNFAKRFFAQQFKRSCLPDGPKVGTIGVSPRGDLSMPSDASSAEWLKIIDTL